MQSSKKIGQGILFVGNLDKLAKQRVGPSRLLPYEYI